jgi:hypothetical protein
VREEQPGISYNEASKCVMRSQNDSAAFHLFLADLYNSCMYPDIHNFDINTQVQYLDLLNNFRDMVDPE